MRNPDHATPRPAAGATTRRRASRRAHLLQALAELRSRLAAIAFTPERELIPPPTVRASLDAPRPSAPAQHATAQHLAAASRDGRAS
jgi:hypothetical protein